MISQWFLVLAEIAVLLVLFSLGLSLLKRVFIVSSGSAGKATDDGESSNLNVNFMIWDSPESMRRKMDTLFKLNDDRKRHNLETYNAILAKAQEDKDNEQNGAALKSV